MANINFYHTQGDTPAALDAILPSLLQKALTGGHKALVVAPTTGRRGRLDESLWSFAESSFMPHATVEDPHPSLQPILLAGAEDDLSAHHSGRVPFILAGAEATLPTLLQTQPERLLYLFTGAVADLDRARPLWKELKGQGHAVTYWQQTAQGWQKK